MSTPAPVRRLVAASGDAVRAAAAHDPDALADAGDRLAACDPELVRVLLGHVLASALSAAHPGGLDGDDVAEVLTTTIEDAAPWWPVEPEVALAVLLGAVGAHADEQAALDPRAVAEHAALIAAQVLRRARRAGTGAAGPSSSGPRVTGPSSSGPPSPDPEPDPEPDPAPAPVAAADVQRALDVHLAAAVAELERAQTVEMP